MKRFLFVGFALTLGACELTESTPSAEVNNIFQNYSVDAEYIENDSSWVTLDKSNGKIIFRKNEGLGVERIEASRGCEALNDNGCAIVSCPADSVQFTFCNVKTWGIDSISFTHEGKLLKGRYFK